MAYHRTDKIEEYEIQQAALRNNKLRLLRHEKEGVIEVEARRWGLNPSLKQWLKLQIRQPCLVQTRHRCLLSLL